MTDAPPAVVPDVSPERDVPEVAAPVRPEAEPGAVPPAGTRRAPVAEPVQERVAPPVAEPVAERPAPPPAAAAAPPPRPRASRYCPVCADRVAVAADGLHCHLGHRLSPAHGRRRRWFGRHS